MAARPAIPEDAAAAAAALTKRTPRYYASDCGWLYAAKCEHCCRRNGDNNYQHVGVARMEKCNWTNRKRCCCTA